MTRPNMRVERMMTVPFPPSPRYGVTSELMDSLSHTPLMGLVEPLAGRGGPTGSHGSGSSPSHHDLRERIEWIASSRLPPSRA
jgi:hypothetical protein